MYRVFISYSHDSNEHKNRVRDLVLRIRSAGVQIILDQDMLPAGPAEGWPLWSEAQVREADKVLIVCTENYKNRYEGTEAPSTGLGCVCEGNAIRQILYNAGSLSMNFRPLILNPSDDAHVPLQLQRYHRFHIYNSAAYDELVAWLTGDRSQPAKGISWPGPSASYQRNLADRLEIFHTFENIITAQSSQRVLLMRGLSNSGKTVLIGELRAYAQHLGISSALIDFKGTPTLDEVFESIRLDLDPSILKQSYSATGTARFLSLISDFQQLVSPLLLVFDTYQQSSADAQKWLESQLLLRLDRAPGLVVVIGGQQVPDHNKYTWRGLAQLMELHPINEPSHWVEYLQRRWQFQAAPGIVEAFTDATNGDPGELSALLEAMVVNRRKKATAQA